MLKTFKITLEESHFIDYFFVGEDESEAMENFNKGFYKSEKRPGRILTDEKFIFPKEIKKTDSPFT